MAATLSPLLVISLAGLVLVRVTKLRRRQLGTFLQCSFHGNLGYIGLAVAYYFLGDDGFTRASILAGFVILLQNFLSVVALSRFNTKPQQKPSMSALLRRILLNPVIISAVAGMTVSLLNLKLPLILDRSLNILSGMALPLALLVIGTSVSFVQMRQQLRVTTLISILKLMFLPAVGLTFFQVAYFV